MTQMSEVEPHTEGPNRHGDESECVVSNPTAARGSALTQWLNENPYLSGKWRRIGREVYARKTLTFSAKEELMLRGLGHDEALNLAATDVFVEKAQYTLSWRARLFVTLGACSATAGAALAVAAGVFIYSRSLADLFRAIEINTFTGTLAIVKASSAGIFVGGAIYMLATLSRALLQEGVALYSRRHALRFGRLYI
jgi:hypothetical protein